jgi:hypothetical protein
MVSRFVCPVVLLASTAAAQTTVYALRANGDLLRLDPESGATQLIGSSGVPCRAGGASAGAEWVYSTGDPAHPGRIVKIDRFTGAVAGSVEIVGLPSGYTPRNLSGYSILHSESPTAPDLLAYITNFSGQCVVIGPTGRRDLEGVAVVSPDFFAIGTAGGGSLYRLDQNTSAATLVGAGNYGDSYNGLTSTASGLISCGSNLLRIDIGTGAATVIGPTGFADLTALAFIARQSCYVNCNTGCNPPPCLNVLDFNCFLNRFLNGDPYANCDESTTPPTLNVLDFNCFLNRFVAGCSAP